MFNPFKYQYLATYVRKTNGQAIARVQSGTIDVEIKIPQSYLPQEVQAGQSFILTLQPTETAKKGEYETLKKLLEDLFLCLFRL